jgi:hypothetical protein
VVSDWWRVWQLSPAERRLLTQALTLLPLTALALRVVGLGRSQGALARLARVGEFPAGTGAAGLILQGRATARLVEVAARRGPYRASCLPRSLTLWWLLRRRGIDSDLRIGVHKETGRLEAHAWVELRGVVLNDGDNVRERFAAFDRAIRPAGGETL